MEEKLANLIYLYKRNNKIIDNDFFIKAYNIINEKFNIETNLTIKKSSITDITNLATYCNFTNALNIYTNKIKKYSLQEKRELKIKNKSDTYLYLLPIKILLHEFEHLKQYKIIQYENTIEGAIIRKDVELEKKYTDYDNILELIYILLYYELKYNKLYYYAPMERLAEIKSNETSIDIARVLEDNHTELIMRNHYYNSLISCYEIDEPTRYYFESFKEKLDWNTINNLNIKEIDKIKLGLKCNKKHLHHLEEKQNEVYDKILIHKKKHL